MYFSSGSFLSYPLSPDLNFVRFKEDSYPTNNRNMNSQSIHSILKFPVYFVTFLKNRNFVLLSFLPMMSDLQTQEIFKNTTLDLKVTLL